MSVAVIAALVLAIVAVASVRAIVARKNQAEVALAHGRLEQGHQLLVAGDPNGAAPYLAAAVAALPDDPVVHRLADIALRDAERRIARFHGTAAAFSPDGRVLAIGHGDGTVHVVDAASGRELRVLPAVGGKVTHVEYAGERILTVAGTGVYLREPDVELVREHASDARVIGDRVIVATSDGVQLDTLAGAVDKRATLAGAHELDVAPDGHAVLAIGKDAIAAWSLPGLAPLATLPSMWWGRWDRDGRIVLATDQLLERFSVDAPDRPVVLQRGDVQPPVRLATGDVVSASMVVDGDATRVLVPDTSTIESVSFDATHFVTGGFDGTLRVWDLARPARPIAILAGGDSIEAYAVTPTRMASIGTHDTVELWDLTNLRTPAVLAPLPAAVGWVTARGGRIAAFVHDPRGDRVAVVDGDKRTELTGWLVGLTATGTVTDNQGSVYLDDGGEHRLIGEGMWNAGLSAGGDRLATSIDGRVALFDTRERASAGGFDTHLHDLATITVDDAGHVVTGHDDGTVRVWDTAGAMLATIHAHTAHISWLEIRGDVLFTSSWDQTVRAWDLTTGASRGIVLSRIRDAVAISPDGRTLATSERAGFVDVWDAGGRQLERLSTTGAVTGVGFVDDTHVIAGTTTGALEIIDLAAPHRSDADIARLAGPLPAE